ncbi:LysM domain-containing protein [Marinospirillum celere]|uniref:LysM domain-containing protein n=1 Tax=Marinospirillum celere TaxID=1122252 RepID=A0A1I1J972_9GAMM|nr:LysM domain-containing protein [Marinospirillum celere]SFC41980.1 LysM domain-containing protein [Marinospirillum celere]
MLTGVVRKFLAALILLVISTGVQAISLKPDAPERYEVKQGDSLWSIAGQYLDDPWMWVQLWQENSQIEDPHRLYPGDVIYLLSDEKSLRLKPRLRVLTLQEPVPFLPMSQVESYLNRDILVDRREFEDSLYIARIEEGRSLGSTGNRIEVLGDLETDMRHFGIYRDIEEVRDPINRRRVLGHLARAVGSARLIRDEEGYTISMEITENFEEVRVGDRLMPFKESPFGEGFNPKPPENAVTGLVVRALKQGVTQIGNYQPVILNQGSGELKPGDLLQILEKGKQRREADGSRVFLGENPRGTAMVYRVFDEASFALIMNSNQPIKPEDNFRKAPASRQ